MSPGAPAGSFADDFSPLLEERLVRLVEAASGIAFDEVKRRELRQDLELRMEEIGEPSFAGYLEKLGADGGTAEMKRLINLITVNETYFFRVPEQFDLLRRVAAPALQGKREKIVRAWSAGCSSGEEVYSILIALRESPELDGFRFHVLGTDINEDVLYVARRAMYGGRTLDKVPGDLLPRYFEPVLGRQQVRAALREQTEFRYLNLVDLPGQPEPSDLDIIFFRNVLIYFSRDTTRRIIADLHRRLRPGGFLFLGPAETLWDISSDFECLMSANSFIYRKPTSPGGAAGTAGAAKLPVATAVPVPPPATPATAPPAPVDKARVLLEEAELMTDLGDYERAQVLVDEVLFLEPDNRAAMVLKLVQLANRNLGRELLQQADRMARRLPVFPEMHYLLGRYFESGNLAREAAREYRRALFIDPGLLQVRERLVRLLHAGGDAGAAGREARNLLAQLQDGHFRLLPTRVAGPFHPEGIRSFCQSLLGR